jgi:hypothetical protein
VRENVGTDKGTLKALPIILLCTNSPLLLLVVDLLGTPLTSQISSRALSFYKTMHTHALSHSLILAETIFKFGLNPSINPLSTILVDDTRFVPLLAGG